MWPARLAMPIGGFLLLLQGFPELFRAFHKMGKDANAISVGLLPRRILSPYFGLSWQCSIRMRRQGEWFNESCLRVHYPKPTIGLIMLAQ